MQRIITWAESDMTRWKLYRGINLNQTDHFLVTSIWEHFEIQCPIQRQGQFFQQAPVSKGNATTQDRLVGCFRSSTIYLSDAGHGPGTPASIWIHIHVILVCLLYCQEQLDLAESSDSQVFVPERVSEEELWSDILIRFLWRKITTFDLRSQEQHSNNNEKELL